MAIEATWGWACFVEPGWNGVPNVAVVRAWGWNHNASIVIKQVPLYQLYRFFCPRFSCRFTLDTKLPWN